MAEALETSRKKRMKQGPSPPWLQWHKGCDRSGRVSLPHPTGSN